MKAKRDDRPFEELYRRLEETVEKLERGGLALEQSIALYEEGMELAKRCQAILDAAEQRITKLRDSFGQRAPLEEAAVEEEPLGEEAFQVEEE
jgi:exodeoxyribonuclease VII small subunit